MTIETDLFSHLNADVGLTALVVDRIFPARADTNTALPYIVFQRVSSPSVQHMTAASSIVGETWQMDVWAATSSSRLAVSEALRESLDGLRNIISSSNVRVVLIENQSDSYQFPDTGEDDGFYRATFDVKIWRERTVPTT